MKNLSKSASWFNLALPIVATAAIVIAMPWVNFPPSITGGGEKATPDVDLAPETKQRHIPQNFNWFAVSFRPRHDSVLVAVKHTARVQYKLHAEGRLVHKWLQCKSDEELMQEMRNEFIRWIESGYDHRFDESLAIAVRTDPWPGREILDKVKSLAADNGYRRCSYMEFLPVIEDLEHEMAKD